MTRGLLGACTVALCSLLASPPLAAQDTAVPFRDRLGFSAGVLGIASGDPRCNDHSGLGAGVEAHTRGRWLLALRADLLSSWAMACSSVGRTTVHEGARVEVFTLSDLAFSPRLSLIAGPTLRMGEVVAEVAAGVGWLYLRGDRRGSFFPFWYGGTVRLRSGDWPVGLELEYGRREVPVRYVLDRRTVHEFGQAEPLWRLAVSF